MLMKKSFFSFKTNFKASSMNSITMLLFNTFWEAQGHHAFIFPPIFHYFPTTGAFSPTLVTFFPDPFQTLNPKP